MEKLNKKAMSDFQKILAVIAIAMIVSGVLLSSEYGKNKVTIA